MNVNKLRKTLLVVIASSAFVLGCELIVDFDRSRIPVEGADATPTIDATVDVTTDQSASDASDASDARDGDAADTGTDAADAADDAPDAD